MIIGMEIHGDVGHTCYDDGELTCVVAKLLLSPNGPDWQTLTAKTPRGLR